MTVLVTGATGLIGREFLRLASAESETVALARDPPGIAASRHDGSPHWLALDLRDPAFARRLPGRLDAIVHLAQSREYRDFPAGALDVVEVNVAATARLLDYARGAGVKRFVFASTATVYEPSHAALSEDSPVRCTSFYAASKRAAELLIEQYRQVMACWLMRIFTVYGEGQRDQLIANLVHRVETGEPVAVRGRLGLPLSPIHAADVARALWHLAVSDDAIREPGCEVVNLGGREALGIRELAEQIGQAIGTAPFLDFSEAEDPPGWIADRTKFERMFRLAEPLAFAAGIRETIAARDRRRVPGPECG